MNTTTLPKRIDVTFTEEDRMTAERYNNINDCLMATALKRMGFNHNTPLHVAPGFVYIGDVRYDGEVYSHEVQHDGGWEKPYYRKSVVGKTITLTRKD